MFWTLICANYTDEELQNLTWWCKAWENIYYYNRGQEIPWKEHA